MSQHYLKHPLEFIKTTFKSICKHFPEGETCKCSCLIPSFSIAFLHIFHPGVMTIVDLTDIKRLLIVEMYGAFPEERKGNGRGKRKSESRSFFFY